MDARTPGAFKILFARIRNKKSGKDEQALCEHTRRREKLAHVSIKIVRQQPVGIRDRFDVVPRIFWQAIIIERRTMGINPAALAKEAYTAVGGLANDRRRCRVAHAVKGQHAKLQRFKVAPPASEQHFGNGLACRNLNPRAMRLLLAGKATAIVSGELLPVEEALPFALLLRRIGPQLSR
jgi:hypothetical protein